MDILEIKESLRDYLIMLAKRRTTSTYWKTARYCGIKYEGGRYPDFFFDLLIEIGNEEDAAGRPWINALVCNDLPGDRFYYWAIKKDKRLNYEVIRKDKEFHQQIIDECHKYWKQYS